MGKKERGCLASSRKPLPHVASHQRLPQVVTALQVTASSLHVATSCKRPFVTDPREQACEAAPVKLSGRIERPDSGRLDGTGAEGVLVSAGKGGEAGHQHDSEGLDDCGDPPAK